MKKSILPLLISPKTGEPLTLEVEDFDKTRQSVKTGTLTDPSGNRFPIIDYIPRFVETDQYASSFSFQWTIHKTTQYAVEGNPFSENQFRRLTNMTPEQLKGKRVLDAGCGSGRFTDIMEKWGAEVIGVDLSYAVHAAQEVLGERENITIIQASIFDLPFKSGSFDFIWSYGVLMATPDTKKAFDSLTPLVKPGGKLAIWVYADYRKLSTFFSDLWRKVTVHLPKRLLYYLCYLSVPLYFIFKIPIFGHLLRNVFIISMRPQWRWRVLETFDWYSPRFQWKHRYPEVFQWYRSAGFRVIHLMEPPCGMVGRKGE